MECLHLAKQHQVIGGVIIAGIRVDWLDRLIWSVNGEPECQELIQNVKTLRMRVKEAEAYHNKLKNLLNQAEESLVKKNLDYTSLANYTIKIFQRHHTLTIVACLWFHSTILFYFWNVKDLKPEQTSNIFKISSNSMHFTFCFELDVFSKPVSQYSGPRARIKESFKK